MKTIKVDLTVAINTFSILWLVGALLEKIIGFEEKLIYEIM